MSKILVINAGSSSVKFKVFARANLKEEQSGEFDIAQAEESYQRVFKQILRNIIDIGEISVVGHRFVHGGEKYHDPLLIDPASLESLAELKELAPLHNPYNLSGIQAAYTYLPNIPSVVVFDTNFFKDLPSIRKSIMACIC